MLSRLFTLTAVAFLFLAVLSSLPAPAAGLPAGQDGAFCAAPLPWEGGATSAANPLEPDQTNVVFLCTSTSCPAGQSCHCGICHPSCALNQRYSCVCGCYDRCPTGYFFDESLCACAAI
jgi:hypothetical protein